MKPAFLKVSATAMALCSVAVMSIPACAEEASPYGDLSATLTMQSDYRFRGISQNNREPTPEAALDWGGPEGFYAGTFLAKIDWGDNNPSFENDWYIGKHTDVGYETDLNTEIIYYGYPDANYSDTASYMEAIGQLSHTFDRLSLTATGAFSPQWSLNGGTGWYAGGAAKYAFTDWLSMSGNLGHQWVEEAPSAYTHWDLGLTATWRAFTVDARYMDTNISKSDCAGFWMATKNACKGGINVTVSYNFSHLI